MKPILLALQRPENIRQESTDIPTASVEKADDKVIKQLREKGVSILPVAQKSNYLMATAQEDTLVGKEDMELLLRLKKQLIWLKLSGAKIEKDAFQLLPKMSNVIRLNLSNTNITDKEVEQLQSLDSLHYLNLVGTKVTKNGILPLKKLKSLQSLYLYQTDIAREDFKTLKSSFPKTEIDSGNYFVPVLASDTTEVKAATAKK
jgi:Leucine-rich repeat (LRR) protein